ncbi:MAG: hypothetical protein OXR66_08430 [Candidatus Woesearchaeota archaeon]|nr:hypothetical protein [Candidatus Woesearchaeota archaeon]
MKLELLRKLEGLQTIPDVAKALNIKESTARNVITKLKKQQHATRWGGPKIYKITLTKQLPRKPGMYDIINKHSKHMKLAEPYDHQVHGEYGPEEALAQAITTNSFRVHLASMCLFNHITNWKKLYRLTKKHWPKIGALYDVTRKYMRTRNMPKRYRKLSGKTRTSLIKGYGTPEYKDIADKWNCDIPFGEKDITSRHL